jgi:drug/metabolite transporter (DMT)-like permease
MNPVAPDDAPPPSADTWDDAPAARRHPFDLPYLLLTLAPLFWSGNFVLGRAVHEAVPPVGLAFWRWVGAFLLVLPFAWPALRRDWPALLRHRRMLLLLSFLGVAAFNTLVYLGLGFTSALNALLLQSAMPVLILAMSFLLFRERVTPLQGFGVALSLTGAVAVITRGDLAALATLALNPGDLVILVAICCYAAYSALLRRRPPVAPLTFLAATFGLGATMLLPAFLLEQAFVRTMSAAAETLLAVAYVAVFPSVLAYFCFNRGVELVGANRAGVFIHLMPLFGGAMAVLFLGEAPRPAHAIGIALILAGIALAARPGRRR